MFVSTQDGKIKLLTVEQVTEEQVWMEDDDPVLIELLNPGISVDPLLKAKEDKRKAISMVFSTAMETFTSGYPIEEMLSWDKQEQEAVAYNLDNTISTPFLSGLANQRGIDLPILVLRVRQKAATYKYGSGTLIGERQRCEDAVDSATTIEDVESITYALPVDFESQLTAVYLGVV